IELCTDNAAMIAGAGAYRFSTGQRDGLDMDAAPTWPLSELTGQRMGRLGQQGS
ncbi:MAG: tRNA (adenosine(37)-N6)-threonylcarbamoyltransferase complex transferase subunit TsaD, partial [Chloroflexota bacterium]|nr:tRNA (adenosine(37)-N6)-threonylcarbamoyltransferase complex transferase subunit TsaD [Chloroflexota bacterium]